jgi:FdhD protein
MNASGSIIKTIKITRADSSSMAGSSGKVIRETNLTVLVNGKPLANIACAGIHLEELGAGFLRSERIVIRKQDIADIRLHKNQINFILKNNKFIPEASIKNIASSGARGKSNIGALTPLNFPDSFTVKASLILKMMDELLNGSAIHNRTGGTHCSALALRKKITILREDIGRHNTIDMLGGYALLQNISLKKAILLTTGRISSEIVYKVWNMGIPVIVSHSAPTANAVTLSKKANILLIGYVRKGNMNIYSQERRVII